MILESVPEGTKITYNYDVELRKLWLRLIGAPIISWFLLPFWKRAVIDRIKEMLEKS
jgi:hypothetical protein